MSERHLPVRWPRRLRDVLGQKFVPDMPRALAEPLDGCSAAGEPSDASTRLLASGSPRSDYLPLTAGETRPSSWLEALPRPTCRIRLGLPLVALIFFGLLSLPTASEGWGDAPAKPSRVSHNHRHRSQRRSRPAPEPGGSSSSGSMIGLNLFLLVCLLLTCFFHRAIKSFFRRADEACVSTKGAPPQATDERVAHSAAEAMEMGAAAPAAAAPAPAAAVPVAAPAASPLSHMPFWAPAAAPAAAPAPSMRVDAAETSEDRLVLAAAKGKNDRIAFLAQQNRERKEREAAAAAAAAAAASAPAPADEPPEDSGDAQMRALLAANQPSPASSRSSLRKKGKSDKKMTFAPEVDAAEAAAAAAAAAEPPAEKKSGWFGGFGGLVNAAKGMVTKAKPTVAKLELPVDKIPLEETAPHAPRNSKEETEDSPKTVAELQTIGEDAEVAELTEKKEEEEEEEEEEVDVNAQQAAALAAFLAGEGQEDTSKKKKKKKKKGGSGRVDGERASRIARVD